MTSVFHRQARPYPRVIGGRGVYLVGADGRRYLDASGGAGVSSLGHGHPEVTRAVKAQLDALAYAHTSFFTNEPMEALADALVARAPAGSGLERVYFTCGGSEAVEAAVKLARQYFVEAGQPARCRFIARRQSYHGGTLAALALGGNPARREVFAPLLPDMEHVSPCFAYRERRAGESDDAYADRLAGELDDTIRALGAETVAAFVAETVVGATAGAVPAVPGYFARIREVCDRHGVLLILDEVMCGMGRTGTLYAFEAEQVRPDLVTLGKGLSGGYQPIGAVLCSGAVHAAIAAGSGELRQGHTFSGHPVACAAGVAVLEVIERDRLLDAVSARGAALARALRARFGDHPHVGDIRGRGLFMALELVADRASARPFAPELKLHARIKRLALDRGLLVYPSGGTIDGRAGDHVLMAPPFIITEPEIELAVERVGDAIDAAIAAAGAA